MTIFPKRILQCAGFTVPRPVSSESLIHQTWGSFLGPSHSNLDGLYLTCEHVFHSRMSKNDHFSKFSINPKKAKPPQFISFLGVSEKFGQMVIFGLSSIKCMVGRQI